MVLLLQLYQLRLPQAIVPLGITQLSPNAVTYNVVVCWVLVHDDLTKFNLDAHMPLLQELHEAAA